MHTGTVGPGCKRAAARTEGIDACDDDIFDFDRTAQMTLAAPVPTG